MVQIRRLSQKIICNRTHQKILRKSSLSNVKKRIDSNLNLFKMANKLIMTLMMLKTGKKLIKKLLKMTEKLSQVLQKTREKLILTLLKMLDKSTQTPLKTMQKPILSLKKLPKTLTQTLQSLTSSNSPICPNTSFSSQKQRN